MRRTRARHLETGVKDDGRGGKSGSRDRKRSIRTNGWVCATRTREGSFEGVAVRVAADKKPLRVVIATLARFERLRGNEMVELHELLFHPPIR